MSMAVIGWVQAYLSEYPEAPYTEERKQALVERIRKRGYNFTHQAHQTMPYAAPFYSDEQYCILNKAQWDEALDEAYQEMKRGIRLMPMDVISMPPVNEVLYEKEKFRKH